MVIKALAKMGMVIPSAPKPVKRPSLGRRLLYTGLVALAFMLLGSTPLYGIERAGTLPFSPIVSIVLAMAAGTLAQLGIGPIVTSSLILQILVGAKILDLDLSDPEARKNFTAASKGLGLILAIVEAAGFVFSGLYWNYPAGVSLWIKLLVFAQLLWGAIIIVMLDEAVQKGWGLGSGVSLFILIGVAQRFFSELLTPTAIQTSGLQTEGEIYGLIPYIVTALKDGTFDVYHTIIGRLAVGYPTLIGFIVSIVLIAILTYLNAAHINVPITMSRYGGIKSRVPLQLLYVTNIPVLLTGILISDIVLILTLLRNFLGVELVESVRPYLSAPSLYSFIYNTMPSIVYTAVFLALCILFGILWIEIAGLNPEAQADNLIKAGLDIPGMRRNPRILASYLSRYIYPLTVFSSIVVAVIALVGDILGSYGTGTGLLLAVGIVYNYYQILAYERTLEMYPLLKRFIGE
uniref:Protein translocase subunit SecY n=1 Tax=Ignisphaera aggregans TaxID=334771 RepID=A0A7C5THI0_9CREN